MAQYYMPGEIGTPRDPDSARIARATREAWAWDHDLDRTMEDLHYEHEALWGEIEESLFYELTAQGSFRGLTYKHINSRNLESWIIKAIGQKRWNELNKYTQHDFIRRAKQLAREIFHA